PNLLRARLCRFGRVCTEVNERISAVAQRNAFRDIGDVACLQRGIAPVLMLIFARSYLSAYDARMGKYFHVMERLGVPYAFIGWRRDESPYQAQAYEILYHRAAKLGAGWK